MEVTKVNLRFWAHTKCLGRLALVSKNIRAGRRFWLLKHLWSLFYFLFNFQGSLISTNPAAFSANSTTMLLPKRLLVLEDDPADSELLRRHLAATWPACEIVEVRHKSAYLSVLPEAEFDLILSDFAIPGFG